MRRPSADRFGTMPAIFVSPMLAGVIVEMFVDVPVSSISISSKSLVVFFEEQALYLNNERIREL